MTSTVKLEMSVCGVKGFAMIDGYGKVNAHPLQAHQKGVRG